MVVRKHVDATDKRSKPGPKARELPLVLSRTAGEKDIGGEIDQGGIREVAVEHPGLNSRSLNGDNPRSLRTGFDEGSLYCVEGIGGGELGPAILAGNVARSVGWGLKSRREKYTSICRNG